MWQIAARGAMSGTAMEEGTDKESNSCGEAAGTLKEREKFVSRGQELLENLHLKREKDNELMNALRKTLEQQVEEIMASVQSAMQELYNKYNEKNRIMFNELEMQLNEIDELEADLNNFKAELSAFCKEMTSDNIKYGQAISSGETSGTLKESQKYTTLVQELIDGIQDKREKNNDLLINLRSQLQLHVEKAMDSVHDTMQIIYHKNNEETRINVDNLECNLTELDNLEIASTSFMMELTTFYEELRETNVHSAAYK